MPYLDKEKNKLCKKKYYQDNRQKSLERSKQSRDRRKAYVNKIKESKPCSDCNKYYPYYVMQFDHIPERGAKIGSINNLIRTAGMQKLLGEIEKCEVVCGNCHSIRTHSRSDIVLV